MQSKKLGGVIIAMPTPLLKNEDIDRPSLCKLIDHCINEGANGIMILGTIGEGTALIESQRRIVVETSVAHAAGRIPVLAAVSDVSTRKSIEFIKLINRSGVDYIVCTTPFYYKFPDPKNILLHLSKIADAVAVPLIFYNASGMTGNEVDVDTTQKILNMEQVAGIKDSSCNLKNFVELLRRYPDKNDRPGFIFQGDESAFDASLLIGADGIVSGAGVAFIKLLVALYTAASSEHKLNAMEYQRKFSHDMAKLLSTDPERNWMYNIKERLVDMDIISNAYVTAPFSPAIKSSKKYEGEHRQA